MSTNGKFTFQMICLNYREWLGLFLPSCPLPTSRSSLATVPVKWKRHSAVCTTGINTTCKGKGPSCRSRCHAWLLPDTALVAILLDWTLLFCVCLRMLRLPTLKASTRVHITAQWKLFSQNLVLSSGLKTFSHCTSTLT